MPCREPAGSAAAPPVTGDGVFVRVRRIPSGSGRALESGIGRRPRARVAAAQRPGTGPVACHPGSDSVPRRHFASSLEMAFAETGRAC